jgi:hypothetical protein
MSLLGKRCVVVKKDGFKKIGNIIDQDAEFIGIQFEDKTTQYIPLIEVSYVEIVIGNVNGK